MTIAQSRRWLGGLVAALMMVGAVLGTSGTPAHAATGDGPQEARTLEIDQGTIFGVMPPGVAPYWFRVVYPGSDRPLGITMQVVGGDEETTTRVNLTVNIKTKFFRADGEDWDYPGYSRLGLATTTGDSGVDRKFWFNTSGEPENYYLRLTNANNKAVVVAITVSSQRETAGSVGGAPADVAPFSKLQATPTPEPTSVPTPAATPTPQIDTGGAPQPSQPVAPAAGEILVVGPDGTPQTIAPALEPAPAIGLDNRNVVVAGIIPAGASYWFRSFYPGGGLPLGITLQMTDDAAKRNALDMFVNIRLIPDETLGEPNVDWHNYSRIGTLTSGEYTGGANRKFWLNFSGTGDSYWLRLNNHSAQPEPFAFAIRRSDQAVALDSFIYDVQQGWSGPAESQ